MKTRVLLTLLAGLLAFGNLQAQPLTLTLEGQNGLPGTTVTVDMTVENFTQIFSYQGTMVWDASVLQFLSVSSPFPGITNVTNTPISSPTPTPTNKLTFLWTDPSAVGLTVDDNEIVLSVTFQIDANVSIGTTTNINIDGSETAVGYSDAINFVFFPLTVNGGTVGVGTSFPVEMLDFQATAQDGNAKLEWITASETDNHYFEVQKSENGVDFFAIGTVEGAGTTQEHTYYQFEDQITASKLFYRLQQVDFDGSASLSDIVELNTNQSENDWIQIYPNPSRHQTHIRLQNWAELDQRFRIQL
ncbi:MAG: cohesin domain-containing protein, partial [Bacteroidota bacterium]